MGTLKLNHLYAEKNALCLLLVFTIIIVGPSLWFQVHLRETQAQGTEVYWETEKMYIRFKQDPKRRITENHQDWQLTLLS